MEVFDTGNSAVSIPPASKRVVSNACSHRAPTLYLVRKGVHCCNMSSQLTYRATLVEPET